MVTVTKEELMFYSKEELVDYILRHCCVNNMIAELEYIHLNTLLEQDAILSEESTKKETALLDKINRMPFDSIEKKIEKMKAYEEYKRLVKKNDKEYKMRQKEINKYRTTEK